MTKLHFLFVVVGVLLVGFLGAQDLSQGLLVNDLTLRPMQPKLKPAYLDTIIDPSFGTTIRRITDAGPGNRIKPMYSTIQAWNADESLMIVYDQSVGDHMLMDGMTYAYIRHLTDFVPRDLEQIFWDFNDPNVFYYMDRFTYNFTKYFVDTQTKQVLADLVALTGCTSGMNMGNDVQMMSWDSDVFGFRCGNSEIYYYRISTNQLVQVNTSNVNYTAPMPGPSGQNFYHQRSVYNAAGNLTYTLNESSGEHSCLGKLPNGNDGHFAVAFANGPNGGCGGNLVAHDLTTGACFSVISEGQGYDYSKSGTHISALAHKNTEGGWVAASMIGFQQDGQALLDQELIIAKAEQGNIKVCRIGHHRSDEDFPHDYWGEPHAVISPTGTRVLFGSDWSGAEDGESIDCYVVELPAFSGPPSNDCVNLDLKIWLEGAYDAASNSMNNQLYNNALLPNNQPFNVAPWNYAGTEGSGWTISDYDVNTVDWVLISLRTSIDPASTVARKAALVRRDGQIILADDCFTDSDLQGGSYYIQIEHRNHVGVMTPATVSISSSTLTYNFQNQDSYVTNSSTGQKEVEAGVWALIAGDVGQDLPSYDVNANDRSLWEVDNGLFNLYLPTDINMDGDVNAADKLMWGYNSGFFSGVLR